MKYIIYIILMSIVTLKADTVGVNMDIWVTDANGDVIANSLTDTQEINFDEIPFATIVKSIPIDEQTNNKLVIEKDKNRILVEKKSLTITKLANKNLLKEFKNRFIAFIMPIVEFVKINPSQFLSLILITALFIYFIFFRPMINRVKNSVNFSPLSA